MINNQLYNAVAKAFNQEPQVVSEGSTAAINYPPPKVTFIAGVETVIPAKNVDGGEQYTVCCPFCRDRRFRLYFSYLWNTKITYGGNTYRCTKHLVRCFNENCQQKPEVFEEICSNVLAAMENATDVYVDANQLAELSAPLETISNQVGKPEILCSLTSPNAPAFILNYLRSRGYDPAQVAEEWGVQIGCPSWPIRRGEAPLAHPILVIPVNQYGKFWFWQGRLVPLDGMPGGPLETDSTGNEYPKYFIPKGAKKKWALYNLDQAEQYTEVVIVEGATDVWRVGPWSVGMFGKVLSPAHIGILRRRFAGRRIILVPDSNDPEAWGSAIKNRRKLVDTAAFADVDITRLPPGTDPGDLRMSREEAWTYIKEHVVSPDNYTNTVGGIPEIQF